MNNLRILVIADNLLARAGLTALLTDQTDLRVVGQVAGGESLADDIDVYRPDVLLWDLGWEPDQALRRFSALADEIGGGLLPVVLLLPDDQHAGESAGLLRAAPSGGLLLRDSSPEMLSSALCAAALGLLIFDPVLAALPAGNSLAEPPSADLTLREIEVLQLLAEGLANKVIAQRLNISDHTVKFHVNAIMSKLNAQSRTEAVVRATRLGLIML